MASGRRYITEQEGGGHQQVLWLCLTGTVAGLRPRGPTNYQAAAFSPGLHTEPGQARDRAPSGKR